MQNDLLIPKCNNNILRECADTKNVNVNFVFTPLL